MAKVVMERTNLSISNIAWEESDRIEAYELLLELGVKFIEIAPTKLFGFKGYNDLEFASKFRQRIRDMYGLSVVSLQSVWYGRSENIFGTKSEVDSLLDYCKEIVLFSKILGCRNIVLGSPKNRVVGDFVGFEERAHYFFSELDSIAKNSNVIISLEANPALYGTDFINSTYELVEFLADKNYTSIRGNLDTGTMIVNETGIEELQDVMSFFNHVHISEPYLKCIKRRELHNKLFDLLRLNNYRNIISIEMKQTSLDNIRSSIIYLRELFMKE